MERLENQKIQAKNNKKQAVPVLLKYFDIVICFAGAMVQGQGEDSCFYSINEKLIAGGVFDGCGGSGARKYEVYGGHSGAYMGSRVLSGMTYDYMSDIALKTDPSQWGKQLKDYYIGALSRYKSAGGKGSGIKGSMVRDFPSTAVFTVSQMKAGMLHTTYYWAGDSRGYLLTKNGLCMITKDDVDGEDALSNLTNDGVLTNVISATGDFEIHEKKVAYKDPCMVITATDGCFNYLPSPMYFEYLLLDTLQRSADTDAWENLLKKEIFLRSGDDHTFVGLVFGYGTFHNMKACYSKRLNYLKNKYIAPWENMTEQNRTTLWMEYQREVNPLHG